MQVLVEAFPRVLRFPGEGVRGRGRIRRCCWGRLGEEEATIVHVAVFFMLPASTLKMHLFHLFFFRCPVRMNTPTVFFFVWPVLWHGYKTHSDGLVCGCRCTRYMILLVYLSKVCTLKPVLSSMRGEYPVQIFVCSCFVLFFSFATRPRAYNTTKRQPLLLFFSPVI